MGDSCQLGIKKTTVHTAFTWALGNAFVKKYMLVYDMSNWKNSDHINIGIGVLNTPKPPPKPVVVPDVPVVTPTDDKP